MMLPGFLFRAIGWRVGHYGPKVAAVFFGDPSPQLLFVQHLVIGWVSAVPLLLILGLARIAHPVAAGGLYGIAYYVLVNSLALPLAFNEPAPWLLGFDHVIPSLIVHLVYGASIGLTSRPYVRTLQRLLSR